MDASLIDVPYSDAWWFKRLFQAFHEKELRSNEKRMTRVEWADELWSWFEGNPPLPTYSAGWKAQATRDVLRMGRANLAKLAVESKMDRIELAGFRVATDATSRQERVNKVSRRLMKRYATAFEDAMLYASVMKDGYVWGGEVQDDGLPLITAERPQDCVTIDDPLDPSLSLAALKLYRDNLTDEEVAHVVLPARDEVVDSVDEDDLDGADAEVILEARPVRVLVFRRKALRKRLNRTFSPDSWDESPGEAGALPDATQTVRGVPVYHVRAPYGLGDFEPHLDLLARINNMIVDRLWITKLQVFRQRALQDKADPEKVGDTDRLPERDPETGKKIDYSQVFEADPGALWELPYGYEIWESTPTDLTPILLSVRDDIKEFASSTRTPLYVFMPDAIQGSAEGAQVAREGQVFKAGTWQKRQTLVFLRAVKMFLALAGEDINAEDELDLVWTPAERYSLTQRSQAAREAKEVGIPLEGIIEDFYQFSPETWQRYKRQRQRDAIQGLYTVPTGTPRTVPTDQQADDAAAAQQQPAADPVTELGQRLDRGEYRSPVPAAPRGRES